MDNNEQSITIAQEKETSHQSNAFQFFYHCDAHKWARTHNIILLLLRLPKKIRKWEI